MSRYIKERTIIEYLKEHDLEFIFNDCRGYSCFSQFIFNIIFPVKIVLHYYIGDKFPFSFYSVEPFIEKERFFKSRCELFSEIDLYLESKSYEICKSLFCKNEVDNSEHLSF